MLYSSVWPFAWKMKWKGHLFLQHFGIWQLQNKILELDKEKMFKVFKLMTSLLRFKGMGIYMKLNITHTLDKRELTWVSLLPSLFSWFMNVEILVGSLGGSFFLISFSRHSISTCLNCLVLESIEYWMSNTGVNIQHSRGHRAKHFWWKIEVLTNCCW